MKRMKNGLLKSAVLGMGIALMLLAGCSNEPKEGTVNIETHNAKSNELIKFNINNAKYLATQWTNAANGRAASTDTLDSLIALVAEVDAAGNTITDENDNVVLKEVEVMEVPKEELQLADWCVPQPVREVYTCTFPAAEREAKGVYTVFDCYIDWWKYTDDTPAPGISMVMYVTPEGEVYDVLNIDGKVKYFLTTWIKENDGEDYLQFDAKGNLFMLAHDDYENKFKIFRFNPVNKMVDTYSLELGKKDDVEIRNFAVTRDGEWVFLNVMVNGIKNNVYAFQVNTNKTITMYEYTAKEKPEEATWAVSSIGIDPKNNLVYWYVDEYNDPLRPDSGLYVAERQDAGYSKNAVKRHAAIGFWDFINVLESKITGNDENPAPENVDDDDYKYVIDYLMKAGGYDRNKYQFDLSYFKDKTAVDIINWEGQPDTIDLSGLYAEDDDGNALVDEAALKYITTTTYAKAYGNPTYPEFDPESPNEAWRKKPLSRTNLTDFFCLYWCGPYDEPKKDEQGNTTINHVKAGASGYTTTTPKYSLPFSGDGMYIQPVFPFEVFIHNKKTGESFGEDTMDKVYLHSALARNYNGIIISNDEGTWVMNDVWDDSIKNNDGSLGDNDHSLVFKLTDKRGNFVCTQPDGLDELEFKPRWSKKYNRKSTDPWFKKPFAANSKGFAALTKEGKTIYYHIGEETIDLLKDSTYDVDKVYSFNLYEDSLICSGVNPNGGKIMLSIDISLDEDGNKSDTFGKITLLPLEKEVESMLPCNY